MATDEIHLREGAEQSSATEFGRVAAAIDEAECIGGERVGGPSRGDTHAVLGLERHLACLRPVTADDWAWLARRLARALENGWQGGPVKSLLRLAGSS